MSKLMGAAFAAGMMFGTTAFAAEVTVPSGDVVALTNALANIANTTIKLEAGVYDLKDIAMEPGSHLVLALEAGKGGREIIGLGNGPEDTILLGGGQARHSLRQHQLRIRHASEHDDHGRLHG